MANKNWKVGDKVIIETVPLKSNTYANLSGVVTEVKRQPAGKKNMLCIECAILYHADVEDMPEGGCPKCGEDSPLVSQLPLSWIRDVLVTLVDAILNE